MSHTVLEKYRNLKVHNDDAAVNRVLAILIKMPLEEQKVFFGHSKHGGRFFMIRHESAPDRVIEYVPDMETDTSVTTLYGEHPIFESRQSLIDAREEIIAAIDHIHMAVPNSTTVKDEGRGKMLTLPELGTAQLIDILAQISK